MNILYIMGAHLISQFYYTMLSSLIKSFNNKQKISEGKETQPIDWHLKDIKILIWKMKLLIFQTKS